MKLIPIFAAFILGAATVGLTVWLTVQWVQPVVINNELGQVQVRPWYVDRPRSAVILDADQQTCRQIVKGGRGDD